MKAMVLTGINRMELVEQDASRIESDSDVLIRLEAAGVCGSDIHYYETGRIGSQIVEYPFRVGHECSGIVEAVGDGVGRVSPGDRVAVDPAMPCYACDQCLEGRHHTCRNLRFLGTPGQAGGCLCEYIVVPEKSCFKAPALSADQAAVVEPLSIGVYAVKKSICMPGARIGILGSGPIGLCVMLPAIEQGAARVYVTDKIDNRCTLAHSLGAYWTGNAADTDIVAAIADQEPGGLDAVFECCGDQGALDQAVALLKPGGKLIIVGIPRTELVSFSIDRLRRKEITIQNIRRQVDCVELSCALIAEKKVNVDPLITHHFAFERAVEAFELVKEYREGVVKAVISFTKKG
ncbi:MAG: alcohol dehydrogenase catalytic domain-containing protein [Chitinivibrionales bacterium]|nr:alcohol dehydrogenase catalytic domain-containing protein [Chitinivibrionales bacterium]